MNTKPLEEIVVDGETLASIYGNLDTQKLRIFLISLMWRMHATDRPAFKNVNLGPYGTSFQHATLLKKACEVPQFDVVFQRFETTETGLLTPVKLRIEGVNGYRFSFSGWSIWAKVDNRPFPDVFSQASLSKANPLVVINSKFKESAEFRAMLEIVKNHK